MPKAPRDPVTSTEDCVYAQGVLSVFQARHPYPLSVVMGLTDHCRLSCRHCLVGEPREAGSLSLAVLERVLGEMARLGVLNLVVTGGDPFLHPEVWPFLEMARALRFAVRVKTTACLVGPREVDQLVSLGIYHLDLSLYSVDASRHDDFVGLPGAWEATLALARQMVYRGGHVQIVFIGMDWNVADVRPLIELCTQSRFSAAIDFGVICRTDGDRSPARLRAEVDAVAAALADNDLVTEAQLHPSPRECEGRVCMGGTSPPFISPGGDVRLCQRLPFVLGNVREKGFTEIWDESPERKRFMALRWGNLQPCAGCELSGHCHRCPASALIEDGDLLGRSTVDCRMALARARASALVLARRRGGAGTAPGL